MAKRITLAEAMKGAQPYPDKINLSREQQYLKVIQALVAENGGECDIAPSIFGDPDTLVCEQDELGNITLKAEKSVFAIN